MGKVHRFHSNGRLSEIAIYNGIIHLAGQVPEKTTTETAYEQTKEVLGLIDQLLSEAGSKKHKLFMLRFILPIWIIMMK